jgi:cytosine/adenosine deaminase-related metal-dependent hydrolase
VSAVRFITQLDRTLNDHIAQLDRILNDRELPGRNADEIAPWRERGRTLTNQWRHLLQHGEASPYQRAEQEADEWRRDMVQRLERKYGRWVATHFNETRESDSRGAPFLSHHAEDDARAERLAQIMEGVGTGQIPPRNQEPF